MAKPDLSRIRAALEQHSGDLDQQATAVELLYRSVEICTALAAEPPAQVEAKPTAYLHEITEPTFGYSYTLSKQADNPWSHWQASHLETCEYKRTALYAATPPAQVEANAKLQRCRDRVRKWLDGGASSWGTPTQDIEALLGGEDA